VNAHRLQTTLADYVIIVCAVLLVVGLFFWNWKPQTEAQYLLIQAVGHDDRLVELSRDQVIQVNGALGTSELQIKQGHARFVQSPCPNKYCILNGWLEHTYEVSTCLPNGVSIAMVAADSLYDSLNF
jgi:hypothetical protein